ncbi:MAG TPA: HAMP domain-containing sensor histidine kinase, partial [Solirubrobacteraceae bacterium]|nr:HAMP domain-containing sensor histidine kinase [Solirubrobacteraceae bacterium]
MPLRRRISIVAATTVAVAVAVAVIASYFIVRGQLVGQITSELKAQGALIQAEYQGPQSTSLLPGLAAKAGGSAQYEQVVRGNGTIYDPQFQGRLPGAAQAASVANGTSPAYMSDVEYAGAPLRMYTFQVMYRAGDLSGQRWMAVQLARPLAPVINILRTLRWVLAIVFLAVVALAAILARLATRRVLTPLAEVTATAQIIGETDDLGRRIEVHDDDEVGQLAASFNEMLGRLESSRAALDASVSAQRQLVADASHELRTPVTSLRTNIEVLLAGGVLDDEDRDRLLADVVEQSEELSTLVSDLIEVARGDMPQDSIEDTRLDRLLEAALDRARRNSPDLCFTADLRPVAVHGNPERLSRAINNLLDNAARHTEPGTQVEITVNGDGVTVRDHGEGIAEQDLPHIFDRFYRGENSRARQGSGLGLAIVRQVVEQHGGTITAANAPDGGAVFTLS